jgi:hypothetical protein
MTRRLGALVLVTLASCAKAPPKKKVVELPPDPRAEVRALLKSVYSTLESGDPDPLTRLIAPDVMVYGLGPSDTFNQRDPLINTLRQELLPLGFKGEVLRIRSARIDVGIAASGDSAWLWDLPRVEYEKSGAVTTWLPRVTAHAIKLQDSWELDAVHVSLGVPDEKIYAPDALKKYLPPGEVFSERGPDSDQLVGLARRVLDDVAVKVDRISERQEVVLLGTGPSELFEGGKTFKDLVKPKLAEIKKSVFSYKVDGAVRSRLGPGHTSGWVAANVILRLGAGKKQQVLPPFRVLWVFVEEKGVWNLVSEHQSLALKDELRSPANDEAIKAWEAVDKVRRARVDEKVERVAQDTGKGGRVIAASDGGVGTFE